MVDLVCSKNNGLLRHRKEAIFFFASFVNILCNPSFDNQIFAATVVDCHLVMDGAAVPPGDRIDCTVHLQPEDAKLRLEVRAYVLDQETKFLPVDATGRRNRDPQGRLLISEEISARVVTTEVSVLIPYVDLAIPIGEHKIAYEVTLQLKGQSVWTQILPITIVKVSDRPRNQMKPQSLGTEQSVRSESMNAQFSFSPERTASRRMGIEDNKISGALAVETPVSIDRGFERSALVNKLDSHERTSGLANQPWRPLSEVATREDRTVYFATNRREVQNDETPDLAASNRFGVEHSEELTLGVCTVNFPVRHHKRGGLEIASFFEQADPEKHFLVEALRQLSKGEFSDSVRQDDLLLFVHGFNNTFNDAILRAGQLHYDAEFPGNILAFSWPSLGSATTEDYKEDTERAEKSVKALADLLENLTNVAATSTPPRNVHVIAHSLGNRLLLAAVHDLAKRDAWKANKPYLGQVVLAAPDVGALRFNNIVGYTVKRAERVSYYYCRSDMALKISQTINNYEPVGLYPFFLEGLDTINADGVDTSFIGHGYYGSSPKVLADFNLLFRYNYGPSQRMPPLSTHTRIYDHDHWSFLPIKIREQ